MLPRPHHLVVSLYVVYESKKLFCGFELDVEQVAGVGLGQGVDPWREGVGEGVGGAVINKFSFSFFLFDF